MAGGWLSGLLDIARGLDRIATAIERVAAVLEGQPPKVVFGDPPPDGPFDVAARNEEEILRADLIERTLTPLLGRRPTPDEIVQQLDEVEWTEGDAAEHVRRVRESTRGQRH